MLLTLLRPQGTVTTGDLVATEAGSDTFVATGSIQSIAPAGKVVGRLIRPEFYQPMFTGRVRKKRQEDIVLLGV